MSYEAAIVSDRRVLTTKGTITPPGGTPISLTSLHIMDWTVDEGEDFPLGSVNSSIYNLRLVNTNNEWSAGGSLRGVYPLKGAVVTLEMGIYETSYTYVDIGSFIVEDVVYNEGDAGITLTGSDKLLTELNAVFDDTLSYPKTIQELLTFTLSQGSITLDDDFGTLPCNGSVSIVADPKWPEGTTIRQVMGYICAATGAFFRVGRNGEYQIVPVYTSTPTHELDTSVYMKLSDDEYVFDFNRVSVKFTETDTLYSVIDSGIAEASNNTITISDNPIFLRTRTANFNLTSDVTVNPKKTYYTKSSSNTYNPVPSPQNESLSRYYVKSYTNNTSTVQSILDGLKTYFTGMTLHGLNIRWRGDPLLRVGDRITLTDRREIETETMVFNQTLTFKQGFSSVVSCELQDNDSLGLVSSVPDPGIEVGGETPTSNDADTLDGHDSSYFAVSGHNHDSDYLGISAKAADSDKLDGSHLSDVLLAIYPVGAIYISTVSTSPATLFGGTWSALGGRILIGADGTYAAGSTGGAAGHSHGLSGGFAKLSYTTGSTTIYLGSKAGEWDSVRSSTLASNVSEVSSSTRSYGLGLGGSTDSGSTLPPYLSVYMWERTA